MASIKDVYELDSKAQTGGIEAGRASLGKLGGALQSLIKMGAAPLKAIAHGVESIGIAAKKVTLAPLKAGLDGLRAGIGIVGKLGKAFSVFGLAVQGVQHLKQ